MKKLKDYVCTFRQAKSFKELGVNQDSLFYYNQRGTLLKQPSRSNLEKISAYTLQELTDIAKNYNFYDNFICENLVLSKDGIKFLVTSIVNYNETARGLATYVLKYLENLRKNG